MNLRVYLKGEAGEGGMDAKKFQLVDQKMEELIKQDRLSEESWSHGKARWLISGPMVCGTSKPDYLWRRIRSFDLFDDQGDHFRRGSYARRGREVGSRGSFIHLFPAAEKDESLKDGKLGAEEGRTVADLLRHTSGRPMVGRRSRQSAAHRKAGVLEG